MALRPPAAGIVRRALVSVYDKRGLLELGVGLAERDIEIIATEGTAKALAAAGIPVTSLYTYLGTQLPLAGRIKTLHPKIHAGLLADRRHEAELQELARVGYPPIDLVVCNIVSFAELTRTRHARDELMRDLDVGGPALLRAAATNAEGGVTAVSDPTEYSRLLSTLTEEGAVPHWLRSELAAKALAAMAEYDAAIATWLASRDANDEGTHALPSRLPPFVKQAELRHGENPHQAGALYLEEGTRRGVAHGRLIAGKPLTYINLLDLDAAYRAVQGFQEHACVVVAHTNPCGLALAGDQPTALERALDGDPKAAYGAVLGFNRPLDPKSAEVLRERDAFVECIVAPGFDPEVREYFKRRVNLRLFEAPEGDPAPALFLHRIGGGILAEEYDRGTSSPEEWTCVTERQPEPGLEEELAFAMHAVGTLSSNAIAITRERQLVGMGTGQLSQVDAVEQALRKAGLRARGAVLASDGFVPFADSIELAARAGIVAIVQPGGSRRDNEIIDACDQAGIAMLFTGQRHFRL